MTDKRWNSWDDSWGDSWDESWGLDEGIGLAPERPPPIDFVMSGGRLVQTFKYLQDSLLTRKALYYDSQRQKRLEKAEIAEMMGLYSRWRKAA